MARNSPRSSSGAPSVTTETFQKHYGRGSGYPGEPSPHHGHPPPPPPPPPPHGYPPQYASGQHAHPQYSHHPPPPPPSQGYHHHHHHHQSWYYHPHAPAASSAGVGHPPSAPPSSSSRRSNNMSHGANKSGTHNVPPSLVTPKSHDSETLSPVPVADTNNGKADSKKSPAASKSNKKASNSKSGTKGKKEKANKSSSSAAIDNKEPEMEEEPKVEPMKQDFHFYAMDNYDEIKKLCEDQLSKSIADGTIAENKEKELYLLTTLLNARLIRNWENAPSSTRSQYMKKEEADRKRFMSEEEVASRHCATLTARRRSPKQGGSNHGRSGGAGGANHMNRATSFGLTSGAVEEIPSSSSTSGKKRGGEDVEPEGVTKRVKV